MKTRALKEWSSLCSHLLSGRIAGLFRKGGLVDGPHDMEGPLGEYWLHPTGFHEERNPVRTGWEIDPESVPWSRWGTEGKIPLPGWCQTTGCYHIHDLGTALVLAQNSPWTDEIIQTRFRYRSPGIFFHTIRVYRPAMVPVVTEDPAWKGCKSFHELDLPEPWPLLEPVLIDDDYKKEVLRIEGILNPLAFA